MTVLGVTDHHLALLSIVLAVIALLISIWTAWRTDRRDVERLERERQEHAANMRARLEIRCTGSSGVVGQQLPRAFNLSAMNTGSSYARDVRVWIQDREGAVVSSAVGGPDLVLKPADPEKALAACSLLHARPPGELEVWVAYRDDAGSHKQAIDVDLT